MYSITSMVIYLSRAIFVAGIFFPVLSILVLLYVYLKDVKESPKGKYCERYLFLKSHPTWRLFSTNKYFSVCMIKFPIHVFSKIFTCGYSYSINWIKHLNKNIKELLIEISYQRKQMRRKMISLQCEYIRIQISNNFFLSKLKNIIVMAFQIMCRLVFCRWNYAYGVMQIW